MIDLRKICHNINTPTSSIITVFDIFEKQIYGPVPTEYQKIIQDTHHAITDLRENLQDIRNYCNYYVDYHDMSMTKLKEKKHLKLNDPYVIHV